MLEIHETISDVNTIARLYLNLVDDGVAGEVFYAGHDLQYFLNLFNTKKNWVCTINGFVVGFGVINEYADSWIRAEVSFAFVRGFHPRKYVDLGKMMLREVFASEPRLKYVYGTTPSRNKTAVKFAKLIGMKQVGLTPNYLDYRGEVDDAVITYAERGIILAD